MDKSRALSWSQISTFEFSKETWYERYVLGKKQESTGAMDFGRKIGEEYPYEPSFKREYKVESMLGPIKLLGFIDAFDLENKKVIELKTGKSWTKKKAESHGQIDLYCAMLFVMHKIHPADLDIKLIWLQTEEDGDFSIKFVKGMKPVIFPLKKSMIDVLNILARVKRVYKEMEEYCLDKELSPARLA